MGRLPPIEVRDQRLRGGRISISARTESRPIWRRREAALRKLLEAGELDVIERLRTRRDPLHIADVQRAVEEGRLSDLRRTGADDLRLGPALDRLVGSVEATRRPATIHQYQLLRRLLLEHFGPDRILSDISSDELEAWLHAPKATNGGRVWSRKRQDLALGMIGRLFNVAIRKEAEVAHRTRTAPRIALNPVANVELGTVAIRRVEFLRPAEWRHLSKALVDRPVHAFIAVGCLAGLRVTETAYLRTDIDVAGLETDDPVIHVRPREGEFEWVAKTTGSVRDVPVGTELAVILRRHVELGYAGRRFFFHAPNADRPLTRTTLQRWTRDAFALAGIRYGRKKDALTFHSLRHTFISWLVQEDVSLLKIQKLAGTSVKMILQVYGHLIDQDLRRAVAVIDRKAKIGGASSVISSENGS